MRTARWETWQYWAICPVVRGLCPSFSVCMLIGRLFPLIPEVPFFPISNIYDEIAKVKLASYMLDNVIVATKLLV